MQLYFTYFSNASHIWMATWNGKPIQDIVSIGIQISSDFWNGFKIYRKILLIWFYIAPYCLLAVGMLAIFLTMVLSSHILFCYLAYVREDWWRKVVKHQEKKVKSELQKKNSQSYINSSYETNDSQSNTL